jgi:hypothetical protein
MPMNTTVKTGPRRPAQAAGQATGGPAAGGGARTGRAAPPQPRGRRLARGAGPGARAGAGAATTVTPDRRGSGPAAVAPDRRPARPAGRAAFAPSGRAAPGQASRTAAPATGGSTHTAAGSTRTTRTTAPARAAQGQPQARPAATGGAGRHSVSRTPFILLVVGLLGGGLLCLLVINTTLEAASFKINALQQSNAQQAQRAQQLQQQVATEESPSSIEQRALRLGMRMQPVLDFIDLRNDRSYTGPARVTGPSAVPGYTR